MPIETTKLGDILLGIESGKNLRCEERPPRPGERGVIKVSAVSWGRFDPLQSKTLPSEYAPPEKTRIKRGDLLLSRANTLELVGSVVLVEEQPDDLFLSDKVLRLVLNDADKKWVLWFLRSEEGRRQIEMRATGNQLSMRNISQEALREIELPYLGNAQRRIVTKLDALTTRLARARAELDRVPALATALRRQALSRAVTGDAQYLAESPGWTTDQCEAIAKRRASYLGARRGSRLRSNVSESLTFLSGARSEWLDCRLADVIDLRIGYAFKSADFCDEPGVPLLRGANVATGRVDWTDRALLHPDVASSFSDYLLSEGDIVIAMDRPLISTGLKIARVDKKGTGSLLVQRVANPKPAKWICADYLMVVLQSDLFIHQIESHATGSDLPHISGNDILTTPCPLPPLELQRRIAEAVHAIFAHADRLEAEAARARALLDRLEAAILTKAFRGELVPQDPNDEPAGVLLERISAERSGAAKPRRGGRKVSSKV
jgi:type I restriction enzyme S subunit